MLKPSAESVSHPGSLRGDVEDETTGHRKRRRSATQAERGEMVYEKP